MEEKLKVTNLKDEAQKSNCSIEAVKRSFEEDICKGKILGIFTPNMTETIFFELTEIEALSFELSSGKVYLNDLAERLNLTVYQARLVIEHLLKINRIDGELTYNTFISKTTLKKMLLEKAKEHKRNHRLKLRNI